MVKENSYFFCYNRDQISLKVTLVVSSWFRCYPYGYVILRIRFFITKFFSAQPSDFLSYFLNFPAIKLS